MTEQQLKRFINEYGSPIKSTLQTFVENFIENMGNPYIMATLMRMLETDSFVKMGATMYDFSDEEKEKLATLKPELIELFTKVREILIKTQ